MSDLLIGLLAWMGVAVVVSVVVGCFMRQPDPDDPSETVAEETGLSMLPGYGWEEEVAGEARVRAEKAARSSQ